MSITQFSGTIYPDKSFSLGIVPREKKRRAESQYDRAHEQQDPVNYSNLTDWLTGSLNIGGKFCSLSEAPLFIRSPKSSRESRGKYGKHGITAFGRRFIKNACILLERKYGKKRLGFATATLPGMDRDTCHAINGQLSDITRRFYQKIRRIYQKRGSQFIYVGCVEIQEKRFGNTGLPVPHLHFVYVAKDGLHTGYTCNTKDFYTAWNESVNECLVRVGMPPIMGHGGHKGSVKLESIRTSAAAYIGKYLSKGCGVVKAMQEKDFEEFPKQWWTACMQTKKLYMSALIKPSQEELKALFYGCEHYLQDGLLTWMSFIDVLINDVYCRMGLVGTMSNEMYDAFRNPG